MNNYTLEKIVFQDVKQLKEVFTQFRKHNEGFYNYIKNFGVSKETLKYLSPQKQIRLFNCNT